jgi:hypothetical protein
MRCSGGGTFFPREKTENGERARCVPAPSRREHGRVEQRLREQVFDGGDVQKIENELERKAVLLAEGNDDAVVRGRGLQLEIERAAEALPQRESPGAVDPRAERRVNDQLHSPRLVEETLGHDRALAGKRAQGGGSRADIQRRLLRAAAVQGAFRDQPLDGVGLPADFRSNVGHFLG